MKYVVSIRRKNSADITVEAANREEALEKASDECRRDDFAWRTTTIEYVSVKEERERGDAR